MAPVVGAPGPDEEAAAAGRGCNYHLESPVNVDEEPTQRKEAAMQRLLRPAAVLYFLSPVIAELLSGSAPPAEFFNPFTFLLLTAFYGSGALLIRETAFRWKKGWPTILCLGLAYGILEEGLAVKSFFDPAWVDLGPLGVYGRWAGVNWVWSVGLSLYHAVFSIGIPILLTALLFPQQRGQPWLGGRAIRLWGAVPAIVVLFCNLFLTPFRPSPFHLLLAGGAITALILLARRLPSTFTLSAPRRLGRPGRVLLHALLATIGLFVTLWVLPNTPLPPGVTLALMLGLALVVGRACARSAAHPSWSDMHRLAVAAGCLSFFILLAPLTQLDRQTSDNRSGLALVALAVGTFLVWLARRLHKPTAAKRSGEEAGAEVAIHA